MIYPKPYSIYLRGTIGFWASEEVYWTAHFAGPGFEAFDPPKMLHVLNSVAAALPAWVRVRDVHKNSQGFYRV